MKTAPVFRSALFLLLCSLAAAAGCSKESSGHSKQKDRAAADSKRPATPGLTVVLKEKSLPAYSSKKIGEAFDAYPFFDRKEWKESVGTGGKIYIDFVGFKATNPPAPQGIAASGVEVKFVIYPDGSFTVAMVSKLEERQGGQIVALPLDDRKKVFDAIYAGKELRL